MSNQIINPLTNRPINVGSAVYWRLVKKGVIQDQTGGQLQPPSNMINKQPMQVQQPIAPKRIQPQFIAPQVSRAYAGLRGQSQTQPIPIPQKPKMPPQQKIQNIIQASSAAYKKTMDSVDQNQFDDEDELTQYIQQELINNLKATGNKHLGKYL